MLINRIMAGILILDNITISPISQRDKYCGDTLYSQTLEQCTSLGLWSEDELITFLVENSFWDIDRQKQLDGLPKQIEECKVELYNCSFRSLDKIKIKEKITSIKGVFENLYRQRHKFDYLTSVGVAHMAKIKYLIGCSLRTCGKRILRGSWWNKSENVIDKCLNFIQDNKIIDSQFRELARSEPWRSYWSARKGGLKLFPNKFFTDDQMSLVSWTGIYDNIYSHQECPPQSVLEDDDCLDGWMIIQRRKRGEADSRNEVDKLITNPKIKNSQEIFIVAQTRKDAQKIDSLNSIGGSIAKLQKFAKIQKDGTVKETDLPDVRNRLQMEMNQAGIRK